MRVRRAAPMKTTLFAAFLATVAAAALPLAPQVRAGTGIQRCQATDGEAIYTDKACAAFGARTVPMSGELLVRLASEPADGSEEAGFDDTGALDVAPAPGRRSVADGCARTPTQLAMDLRGAFALGDVNRIAESYDWAGMSHRTAMGVMDRLAMLGRRQLVDTQYFDATISTLATYADASASGTGDGAAGVLQAMFSDDGRVAAITDFEVRRQAGCYFVRF